MKSHHGHRNATVCQRSQQSAGRFLCFKPIGAETDHVTDKALFSEDDKEIKIDSSGKKRSGRKGFSRALKAVLFHPKSRIRNAEQSAGEGSFSKRNNDLESEIGLTKSPSMRSTSSSCSSSSSCLSSHPSESPTAYITSHSKSNLLNPKPSKQNNLKKQSSVVKQSKYLKQRFGLRSPFLIGVVLITISLTLTIFWGRLWAIGLNAVWLCSIPKQGKTKLTSLTSRTTSFEKGSEIEERIECSAEQRRRVIMEGLLDRRHHHHHHHENC